tara:strand:+ start:28 stop:264 length:237 start_codon:yes stop_codon:yes gene_type:complete
MDYRIMGNFIVGMAVGITLSVFGMGKIVDTVEAFVDGSKRAIQESIQDERQNYPVERHWQNFVPSDGSSFLNKLIIKL